MNQEPCDPPPERAGRPDGPIDLRSDTVTRPTKQMRAAMAAAEVGDDVLDGDPTLRELEVRVAGLLGTADALWTPSGSMANLIALTSHLSRGDAFLAPAGAHVLDNELGTAAWLAGGMPRALPHDAGPGKISPDAVRRAAGSPGPYYALRTTLLCLENTHNAAGGTVTAPDEHASLAAAARRANLRVHLDGARLWHAAVALGVPPGALTVGADTVQVCLSKGSGRAGRLAGGRFGGVRRRGAAAAQDARRRGAAGRGARGGGPRGARPRSTGSPKTTPRPPRWPRASPSAAGPVSAPQTNIVLVTVADLAGTLERFEQAGVRATPMAGRVRLMTHADVTDADITAALDRIGPVEAGRGGRDGARAPFAAPRRGPRRRRPLSARGRLRTLCATSHPVDGVRSDTKGCEDALLAAGARVEGGARGYDATAIPGMPFSSPSSADVTVTEKRSIDSGVSRSR